MTKRCDLGRRNHEIIRLRTEKTMTLDEIGKIYGISRERVRQITLGSGVNVVKMRKAYLQEKILACPVHYTFAQIEEETGAGSALIYETQKSAGITKEVVRKARFYLNVPKKNGDECQEWGGYLHPKSGYGRYAVIKPNLQYAHRFSWYYEHGDIPEGMCVLHRCDNPPCVNIDHLFLGTMADNTLDRDRKGRQARGERMGNSILTREQVMSARRLKKENPDLSFPEIVDLLGVDAAPRTVSQAISGITWKHLAQIT